MTDGPTALQAAIYAALIAAPPIGANVYDVVPPNAVFPHIEMAGGTLLSANAIVLSADTHTVEIHVWSRYSGFAEARTLMQAVRDRLDLAGLALTGAALTFIKFAGSDLVMDADGLTVHGIVRFKAMVTT